MVLLTAGYYFASITPDPWLLRLLFFVFTAGILISLYRARRGEPVYIRRLPGLDKIDEAVGRAVEMGRPVFFVPGIGGISDPATLTAFGLLDRAATRCARYNVRLLVVTAEPVAVPIITNIIREAYRSENKLEYFIEDNIRYLPGGQFPFAVAAMGWMRRERVAASLLFGAFFAESLMLSETGQQLGAIQIAGTPQPLQIPFLVTTCDYVLIVEEYLAAHAYLTREPVHVASIRMQDLMKALMVFVVVLGIAAATVQAAGLTDFNWAEEGIEKFFKPLREWLFS